MAMFPYGGPMEIPRTTSGTLPISRHLSGHWQFRDVHWSMSSATGSVNEDEELDEERLELLE